MKKINRPIIWVTIGFILGIIEGEMFLNKGHFLLFLSFIFIGILALTYYYDGKMISGILIISFFLGGLITLESSPIKEKKYFTPNKVIEIEGKVEEIDKGAFNTRVLLKKVVIKAEENGQPIQSKVSIQMPVSVSVKPLDTLRVKGTVLMPSKKMNPSDMDYERYLLGKNTVATVKSTSFSVVEGRLPSYLALKGTLGTRIDKVFQNNDQGIMEAILIGETSAITDDVYKLYSGVGIVHVLSISGFHIALLISIILLLLGYLGIPYTLRYSLIGIAIWYYAFLSGSSMPTVRACIMATLLIIARCIWEEEDAFTSLTLAALMILIVRPFQLYQVGFQLSFVAVGSLLFSNKLVERFESLGSKKQQKLLKTVVPWLAVTLGTSPILAFHFYEIPFLCSLLNLALIPVFSFIIIVGWILLLFSFFHLQLAIEIGKLIIILLRGIEIIADRMIKMPLGTLCVGKVSLGELIVYYSVLAIVFLFLMGYIKKIVYLKIALMSIVLLPMIKSFYPQTLELTHLYVGQGDAMVMTTSRGKVILIDGGDFGKGKTIEKYIKYKGKKSVEAIVISHSDADHIGGIIDLLKSNIRVKNIFMSQTDQSPLKDEMEVLCREKEIDLYQVGYLDSVIIDEIQIDYLTPKSSVALADINDNSLSCLITYKNFSALFTGDLSKAVEREAFRNLGRVNVLKVAHHGSKTSTDEKTLFEIKPNYAIISSGINNRYGHPHASVLESLSRQSIATLRTDTQGAVTMTTDGEELLLCTQIEGDQ